MISFDPIIYIPIIVISIIIIIIKIFNLSPITTVLFVWITLTFTPLIILIISDILGKSHNNNDNPFMSTIPISSSMIMLAPLIYNIRSYFYIN